MIRSLRMRLFLGTTLVSVLVLGILGFAIHQAVRRTLTTEFDRVLLAKARSLASMVEWEDGAIRFDFDQSQFPEFGAVAQSGGGGAARPAYFEVFLNDSPYARSQSLGTGHLAAGKIPGASGATQLPDGRPGRLYLLEFKPYVSPVNPPGELANARLPAGLLAVAQDTSDLERTLSRVGLFTFGLCGIAILLSGAALVIVAGRAVRPVRVLAGQIEQYPEADLSASFDTGAFPSELAPVADRLNGLLRRLREAFARERAFTADVAHELRTPLAGLRATMEVCRARPRDSHGYEVAIDKSLAMLTQMQTLIESLLLMARADGGQLTVQSAPVDVVDLIQESWQSFEARAAARGLSFTCDSSVISYVMADRELLRIVFNNLFDNAVSYAHTGSTIQVRFAGGEAHPAIEVVSQGHSLSTEDVPRLVERFWRKDSARAATGLHAGLGLSLCQRLTTLQHGHMSLRLDGDLFVARVDLNPAATPIPAESHLVI